MTKNSDDGKRAMVFVFTDPYRTRPRGGVKHMLSLSSLFMSIPQAPARAQSPTRNTRIKRRNFARTIFGVIFMFQDQGLIRALIINVLRMRILYLKKLKSVS